MSIADLSTTAGSNTAINGQSIAGSANANTIDSMFQATAALLAQFYDDIGGVGAVSGTGDAIVLTSGSGFTSLANGLVVAFKAGAANTTAAVINVDTLGDKAIRRQGDSALSAGDIVANGIYLLRYDTAYDTAAGAWVLLNAITSASSLDLIGTLTTTSGSTQSLTGISSTYKHLAIVIDGVSHSHSSDAGLNVAFSSNNGSSYGTAQSLIAASGNDAGDIWYGSGIIYRTGIAGQNKVGNFGFIPTVGNGRTGVAETVITGVVNAIQFSVSGGAFDAGQILIYGMR